MHGRPGVLPLGYATAHEWKTRLTSLETCVNFFLSNLLEWEGVGEGAMVSRVWNIEVIVRALVLAPM